MKIAVVGLGIIGGSIARALKKNTAHRVDGWNRSERAKKIALLSGYIDGVATDLTEYDVVFVALPLQATVDFINEHTFKDGAIIADICGVKVPIRAAMNEKECNFRFVGTHPMAGNENTGIEASGEDLFQNCNVVIVREKETDLAALKTIADLYVAMGADRIVYCTAAYHDRKMAHASQLPHVVANALVRMKEADGCFGFTGGSYRDVTRVAALDENTWAELFLSNRESLIEELKELSSSLTEYAKALEEGDETLLKVLLVDGTKKKRAERSAGKKRGE